MATLRDLAQRSLRELRQAYVGKKISCQISNHAGAEAIKAVVQDGQQRYDDYGNFAGSLVMLMLLYPKTFQLAEDGNSLLPVVDGKGTRAEVLRNEGLKDQESGKGQNNYRTNLLEALLDNLYGEAQDTQKLWKLVAIWTQEYEESWDMAQGDFIDWLVSEKGDVVCSEAQLLAFDTCREFGLEPSAYYKYLKKIVIYFQNNGAKLRNYAEIRKVSECSTQNAKQMWDAIQCVQRKFSKAIALDEMD